MGCTLGVSRERCVLEMNKRKVENIKPAISVDEFNQNRGKGMLPRLNVEKILVIFFHKRKQQSLF